MRTTFAIIGKLLAIVGAAFLMSGALMCSGCFKYGDVGPYPWWMEPTDTFFPLVAIGIVLVAGAAIYRRVKR